MRTNHRRTEHWTLRVGIGALLGSLWVTAAAQTAGPQWSADIAAGVEHTDNLNRTEQSPESASFGTARGHFTLLQQTRTLYADFDGVGIWRDFPTGTPGPDFTPAADTLVVWTPVAERFSWRLSDNLGEIAPSSNGALAPVNRERLNVLSTGPNLQIPWGDSNWFTAAARYGRVDYQISPADGNRVAGQLGVAHGLDNGALLSLNVSQARTSLDSTDVRYDIGSLYANYLQTGARGAIDGSVGVSRLRNSSDQSTGAYADVRLMRELTAQTSIVLDLVHRYGDAAAVFSRQQDLETDIGSIANVQPSGQALRETAADLSLTWGARRTDAGFTLYHYRETQYGTSATTHRRGTDVLGYFEFKLLPNFIIGGEGAERWWSDETTDSARASELRGYVTWQFLSRLGLSAGAEHYTQSHSLQNYTETRYFAALAWQVTRSEVVRERPTFDTAARRRIQYGR